jgi:hypothetical protein
MAEIEIKHWFIRTSEAEGEADAPNTAELVAIGEDGKEYQFENRFLGPDGDWLKSPMDIIEIDDSAETPEEGTPEDVPNLGADDPADNEQPPANTFGGNEDGQA